MENIQKKLDELYFNYLSRIFDDKDVFEAIQNYEISSPLLIDVNAPQGNYLKRKFRVLYIGKENNGWFNEKERAKAGLKKITDINTYLTELKKLYYNFNIGIEYNKPIFRFLDILIDKIQTHYGGEESTGFLWTNLIRHSGDYGTGKIIDKYIDKVMYENNKILREEIKILNPDAVVFITGPNYDKFLEKTFKNIKIEKIKPNYDKREIAILKHDELELPKKSIRIFHPDYQNRLDGIGYMKEISQDIIECFSKIN